MAKYEGQCRLCLEHRPLVEAHVIPRALALEIGTDSDPLRVIKQSAADRGRRLRSGPYARILCEPCEQSLGPWDAYGVSFLRRQPAVTELRPDSIRPQTVELGDVKYRELKMFALSTLWRAHASQIREFGYVKLGPLESELRDRVRKGDPGERDDFSVFIEWYFNDPHMLWMPWEPSTVYGIRHYRTFLHGHMMGVKADSRVLHGDILDLLLAPGKPVRMQVRDITKGAFADGLRRFMRHRGDL